MLDRIGYWWIRLYYKLFKPNHLIKIITSSEFDVGETIIASRSTRDLLHLGEGYYILKNKT